MLKKRWFRLLVCLVLVACMLVNISPIRAEAIPIDPFTIGYVTKEVAFWAISLGLGISFGVEAIEQASRFADNFAVWSVGNLNDETVKLMQDDMIQLMATGNPDMPWMVDSRLVDGVREWMFESETVTGGSEAEDGMMYYGDTLSLTMKHYSSYPYEILYSEGNFNYMVYSPVPFVWKGKRDGMDVYSPEEQTSCFVRSASDPTSYWTNGSYIKYGGGSQSVTSPLWSNFDLQNGDGTTLFSASEPSSTLPISVSEGLTAHQIAPKDEDFATGYSEWAAGAVTVPAGTVGNASDITALPIGIGKDLEETISATQQDVWNGNSTYTDTSTDTPGTDTEDGTGTGTGSGAGAGVNLTGITQILNNIHSFQQSGTIGTQSRVEGLGEILGDTNTILNDGKSLLSSILAANAFGFDAVQQSVISLPGAIGDELTDIEDLLGVISGALAGTKTGALSDIIAWVQALAQDLAGVKEKVESLPTDIAEAVSQAVVPSATAGLYALDLTEFFPFCIPFDIYEFLSILSATPVAPCMEFDVYLPIVEVNWHIEIDLSAWNDTAALVRKLELLLFTIGLAYVCREKFLRA